MSEQEETQMRQRYQATANLLLVAERRGAMLLEALSTLIALVEEEEHFNDPSETDCYVALRHARDAVFHARDT